jgi:hypothetical protein
VPKFKIEPVFVITVESMPSPIMVNALLPRLISPVHVSDPVGIIIVSPADAAVTAVCTSS